MKEENQIVAILKQYGLRLTRTRRAVLELLLRKHTPLSAPKILSELEKVSIRVNKTTVYRELEKLAAIGLLQRMQLQDRKQYYELTARGHHHHFVCTICHEITDIEIDESTVLAKAERLGRQAGFHITTHAVEFYGQCAACLKTFLFHQSL